MLRNHPKPMEEDGRIYSPLPNPVPIGNLPVMFPPQQSFATKDITERPPITTLPVHEPFPGKLPPPSFMSSMDGPLPQPFEGRDPPKDAGNKRGPPPPPPSRGGNSGSVPGSAGESSSSESSEESGGTVVTIISPSGGMGNSQIVYNTPDGAETDPDLLQAELMFFNTPAKEHLSAQVYDAFNNVQEQCAYDYVRLCQQPTGISEISFNDPFFFPPLFASFFATPGLIDGERRKLSALKQGDEALAAIAPTAALSNKVVGYFREFYQGKRSLASITTSVVPTSNQVKLETKEKDFKVRPRIPTMRTRTMKPSSELAKENANKKKMVRRLKDHDHREHDRDHHDHPPKDDKDPRGPPPQNGAPPKDKDPRGPPSAVNDDTDDGDDRHDHHKHHDRHHDRDHHDRHDHDDHHHDHHREDTYFTGALGFGAEGDMCMYQNANQLSDPCVNAISNVYSLREEYWNETESSQGHDHCGIFFFLMALCALVYGIRRFKTRHHRKAAKDLLVGLNNDPELKKAVEAKLGLSVPPVPVCPFHANNQQGSNNPYPAFACFKKVLYAIFVVVMAFVASFFITLTSLIMTGVIVRGTGMEVVNNETGEVEKEPSTWVVVLILFTISFIQVKILAKLVRKFKVWYRFNYGDDTPSAPPAPVEHNSQSPSSGPSDGSSGARRLALLPASFSNWISPRVAAVRNAFRRDPEGYAPLGSGDDSTEMIAIGSAYAPMQATTSAMNAPRVAVYTGVPITHNGSTAVVTATPVTHVTFV